MREKIVKTFSTCSGKHYLTLARREVVQSELDILTILPPCVVIEVEANSFGVSAVVTRIIFCDSVVHIVLLYTTSIQYISALSNENFKEFQSIFLIEIESQRKKCPGVFLPTPSKRGSAAIVIKGG